MTTYTSTNISYILLQGYILGNFCKRVKELYEMEYSLILCKENIHNYKTVFKANAANANSFAAFALM